MASLDRGRARAHGRSHHRWRPNVAVAAAFATWILLLSAAVVSAYARPDSVYVGSAEGESISQFSRHTDGGLAPLIPASLSVGGDPVGLVASPNGRYLYAAVDVPGESSPLDSFVAEFAVGPDGTIAPLASPRVSLGASPSSISISPDGSHVYVTDYDGVTPAVAQFAVATDGELTPLSPARVPVEGATAISISPDSRHVYVVDGESSGLVWQFEASPDGALHPLTPASLAAGFKPYALAISPDDRDIYVIVNREEMLQYDINADGTLHPLAPAAASSSGLMGSVAITPDGKHVVAGEFAGVERFERHADGTLSSLGTTPVEGAPLPLRSRATGATSTSPTGSPPPAATGSSSLGSVQRRCSNPFRPQAWKQAAALDRSQSPRRRQPAKPPRHRRPPRPPRLQPLALPRPLRARSLPTRSPLRAGAPATARSSASMPR